MDPLTAGVSSFATGLASGLTGGSSSATSRSDQAFDSSGWNVQFGDGSIATERTQSGAMAEYMPYLIFAGGLLIVWRMTRKKT